MSVLSLLWEKPHYAEFMRRVLQYHIENESDWKDIQGIENGCAPGITGKALSTLYHEGLLDKVYESNKYKTYRIKDPAEWTVALREFDRAQKETVVETKLEIPDDLFAPVVGMRKEIFLIRQSLGSFVGDGKPVHMLFVGLPGTAKSLLLDEISRIKGAVRTVGSGSSKAGIADLLFARRPKILIVDELDKMAKADYDVLLEVQEQGTVTQTKHGKTRKLTINLLVFAAANDLNRIPEPNFDRFMVRRIKEYTEKEYKTTAKMVLMQREGAGEEIAEYIADVAWDKLGSKSIRKPIQIYRMAKTKKEVDELLEVLMNGEE